MYPTEERRAGQRLPEPRRAPRDATDFERLCAEWMTWFGLPGVRMTTPGADGGVDVVAEGVIAQAKFHPSQKTSVAAVRDLIGCKTIYRAREAWFFTYLGYTAEVLRLGASGHVELFRFDAASLRFRGETERARLLCSGQLNLAIPRMAVKLPSGRWIRIGDRIRVSGGRTAVVHQILGETVHLRLEDGSQRQIRASALQEPR